MSLGRTAQTCPHGLTNEFHTHRDAVSQLCTDARCRCGNIERKIEKRTWTGREAEHVADLECRIVCDKLAKRMAAGRVAFDDASVVQCDEERARGWREDCARQQTQLGKLTHRLQSAAVPQSDSALDVGAQEEVATGTQRERHDRVVGASELPPGIAVAIMQAVYAQGPTV
jgi:hypothetical protein